MAQVAVQGLRTRGTEENGAQQPEAVRVGPDELKGIPGVEGAYDGKVICQVHDAQYGQHGEPDGHDGTEEFSDGRCAELLHEEEQHQDAQHDVDNGVLADMVQCRDVLEAFHRRGDGDGRGDDPVGQQRCASDHGRQHQPFLPPPHQGIEREGAALSPVICPEDQDHILEGGLEGNGPDDAGKRSDDQVLCNNLIRNDLVENVEGGGSDIPVNDAQSHQQPRRRDLV